MKFEDFRKMSEDDLEDYVRTKGEKYAAIAWMLVMTGFILYDALVGLKRPKPRVH